VNTQDNSLCGVRLPLLRLAQLLVAKWGEDEALRRAAFVAGQNTHKAMLLTKLIAKGVPR
jgi:hypothetical protein